MITSFQTTFFYISHEKKKSVLEKSFLEVKEQLNIYENQYSLTQKSYLNSWNEELETLNNNFSKSRKKCTEHYESLINETSSDDDHSYALHASGLQYLDERNYEEVEKIKIKYLDFLDLYSKSILIALYSLNENFLNKTCDITSEIFKQKIKSSHFNSNDYLNKSINYLNLVIDIPISNLEKYISKFKDIQFLRNKIIHEGSKFSNDQINDIVKRNSVNLFYDKNNEFLKIIKPGFIEELFQLYREFYEELLWLIEERQKFNTIENSLKYWFGLLDRHIFIKEIDYKKNSGKIRTLTFQISSRKKNIPKVSGKITFTKSTGYKYEVINQTDCKAIEEFVNTQNESQGIHLENTFELFKAFEEKMDIKILIY